MRRGRARTSPIWLSVDDLEFKKIIASSFGFKEALSYFGLDNKGSNCKTLKKELMS